MKANCGLVCIFVVVVSLSGPCAALAAEHEGECIPKPIRVEAKAREGGWTEWSGIVSHSTLAGERLSALFLDRQETVWIGTSQGRVLSRSTGNWTLEAEADAAVTGIAVDGPRRVWVSTSDGLRRLDQQPANSWTMTSYRTYYQGHPAFVSGGYIPDFDAERFWGYVDGLYIPSKVTTYAPFVVSTEHGLFTWGGYHGVWHHFLPHYRGANSAWLDTRDLIPHRRPTCMLEDAAGNLWVGTDGDGIVRFDAQAREYFRRDPEHNQKDGREFSTFGTNEVGCPFDSVVGLSSSGTDHPLWVLVQSRQGKIWLARYHDEKWSTLPLEHKARCLVEVEPGVVLIGTDHGLMKVNFETRKTERLRGFDDNVFNNIFGIAVTANGTVLCASYWAFSEKTKTPTN